MPILGMRTDENFITNQRPQNWRQTILMLYPNSAEIAKAPLTALTAMMKDEKTDDPVFHWFQKQLDARRLKITEDIDTTETGFDVDNTYQVAFIVKAGDMLWIEQTGEIVRVASDPTANNLITVTRAQAGTSGTAFTIATSNPYATVIGSAFEEGSLAPTGVNYDPVEAYNYTQIFRSTFEMTRTAQMTRLRTGDQVKEAKRECLEYFTVDMERAFWFNGSRTLVTINGKPARMTAGVINQIVAGAPGNVMPAPTGGLINADWLDAFMQSAFAYGSTEKVVFGSNLVLGAWNTAVRKSSVYNIENGVKEYGMRVSRIQSPFGTLVFKVHPLFNQTAGGTASDGVTVYQSIRNNMYVLDMQFIRYRYLLDVQYQPDLTPIGLDGEKSGYIAECGLEVNQPLAHWIATGITGGDV
jgi:hypothetical protein